MVNTASVELNDGKGDKAGASVTYTTDKGEVKVTFGYEKEVKNMGTGINNQYPDLEKTYTHLLITVYKNGKEAYKERPLVASEYNDPTFSKEGKVDLQKNLEDYRHKSMIFCASEYEPEARSAYDEIIERAAIEARLALKEKEKEKEKENKNKKHITMQQIQNAMTGETR